MRKGLFLLVCLLIFSSLKANVIYVANGASGNGSSWEKAYGDLHDALATARFGDEIWVAEGIYYTSETGNRDASFKLIEGVNVLGGFRGYETDRSMRNPSEYKTILSGEIGTSSIDDNAFTIIYAENISQNTIVDGFLITGGVANGFGDSGELNSSGAAWFNYSASPTIENCIFQNNYGREGAAIYNLAVEGGISSPIVIDCKFLYNEADLDGGAVFNNGSNGECSPVFEYCKFENNRATYGAGMMNKGVNGKAIPTLINCTFKRNLSIIKGSAIYNFRHGNGISDTILQGCIFEDNDEMVGNDISNTVNNIENESAINGTLDQSKPSGVYYRTY